MDKTTTPPPSADSIEKIAEEMAGYHDISGLMPAYKLRDWAQRLRALPSLAELERDAQQALGFAWAYACVLLDKGEDPRLHEVPRLLEAWHAARAKEAPR